MAALENAVQALLDSLAGSGAQAIRVHIIDFDSDATALGTFDLIAGGVVNANALDDAKEAVEDMSASGGTNYEHGLYLAHQYISGATATDPLPGADINKVLFISDGEPTYYMNNNYGSRDGDGLNLGDSMVHVLGLGDGDTTNEPMLIEAIPGWSIEAIGINVTSGNLARLSDIEDGVSGAAGGGSATNVTSAEQLAAVVSVLGGSTAPAAAGNDTINAGDGADIVFGDVLHTDSLATARGVSLPAGSGWAVFQTLENRANNETADPAGNGADWTRADTVAYIAASHLALSAESGRAGGNDVIDGGAGADIIYGQEGNDVISGGADNDTISGGSGNDTINYAVNDGRDVVDGGTGTDTVVVTGSGVAENFFLETVAAYNARIPTPYVGLATTALLSNTAGAIMVEMNNVELVTINGGGGGDTLTVSGDFAGTAILNATIRFNGEAGDDTLDLNNRTDNRRVVADGGDNTDTVKLGFAYNQATYALISGGVAITHHGITDEFTNFENFTFETGSPVTLTLADIINDAPTDIAIDGGNSDSVAENSALGTVVGLLSTTDPEAWQTHTYAITGGTGLGKFSIVGNEIRVSGALDFETAPSYTLDISSTDNGIAALSRTETFTINVTNVNDAPMVSNLNGDTATFLAATGVPVLIDQGGNTTVADIDSANFDTGVLTVAITANGVPSEDVLLIGNIGSITTGAGTVSFSGTQIGTFTGGTGGTNLVVTLDADATPAAVQALVRALQYDNTNGANPDLDPRTITVSVTDGDGATSNVSTVTVNVDDNLPPAAGDDNVITNIVDGSAIVIPHAALLANDTDVDLDTLSVTATSGATGGSAANGGGSVTFTPTLGAPTTLLGSNFSVDQGGFTYSDGFFGGTASDADGSRVAAGDGGTNGALHIDLGGVSNTVRTNMNGAFTQSFTLGAAAEVTITFRYRLQLSGETDNNDDARVLARIDGTNLGTGGIVSELEGQSSSSAGGDTGWQTFTTTLSLSAGSHTLALGGLMTSKNATNESADVDFDNVSITTPAPFTGSFNYTVSDSTAGDDAGHVTITGINGSTLTGTAGSDIIIAGGGNDTIAGAQNDARLDGGAGTDTLSVAISFDDASDAQIVGIEKVVLTAGVTLDLASQTEAFAITGSGSADTIIGGGGADKIFGGSGNDTLKGNGGVDQFRLTTNGGTDTITGLC